MESIKFCKGPSFSIFPLMKLLKSNEASYKLICDNWLLFGCSLGLNKHELDGLGEKLNSGRTEIQDMPREILRLWKGGHEEDANLKVLFDALLDVEVEDLADAVRDMFGGGASDVVLPPAAKRLRGDHSATSQNEVETEDRVDLNVPDKDVYVPLLRAIHDGKSVASIKKLLDDSANPNVTANDDRKGNAAHEVIDSLIHKKLDAKEALAILDMLVSKGFNLINMKDAEGFTPLLIAMQFEDLNEALLSWFFTNGADFNAYEVETGYSILLQAIWKRQGVGIIRKILDFGSDPKHITVNNENALHISACYAHESALEIFIEKLNVNVKDGQGNTQLHFLFMNDDLDYQHCLKLLLRKGADFGAKCNKGYVPLVEWMKFDGGNPFPTLMKMKDRLPITEEMACTTLTAIVEEMKRLLKFLPASSRDSQNEFAQFITFLIQDKKAKLHVKDEDKWKEENWGKLSKHILTRNFLTEMKTTSRIKWNGDIIQIRASVLGELDFHSKSCSVSMSIETAIICLIASKKFKALVELCEVLEGFCELV